MFANKILKIYIKTVLGSIKNLCLTVKYKPMNSTILNVSINDNIIKYTTNHILKRSNKLMDFSDICIILPSKRSSLFIKKELSKKLKKAFIPPKFVTFDELVSELDKNYGNRKGISDIDSAYIIYEIVKNNIKSNDFTDITFSNFFEWSYEILNFIHALDVEKIDNEKLLNLKLNADIGYDLPSNINSLLKNLHDIRILFHNKLDLLNKTTLGYSYYNASKYVSEYLSDYRRIIVFNPYYLNKAETDLIKVLYDEQKLDVIIKGDSRNWKSLKTIYTVLNVDEKNNIKDVIHDNINIYSVNDNHLQACLAKDLISKIPQEQHENTVVIVPDNSILQTVMSQLYCIEKNVNIAVGYPAKKTTIFSLMNSLIQTQKNKKNSNSYYVKDIISVISNPLVKNMRFIGKPEITRIIVHEIIKNFDRFNEEALFKGCKFITLDEIINNEKLCAIISEKVSNYWEPVSSEKIKKLIAEIFELFIISFGKSSTMKDFGFCLKDIADNIINKSLINTYSFNIGAINILYDISNRFINSICSSEIFGTKEILNILENILLKGNISLIGSPLKGLQVLGLMESRGLSFDNVFVLSMTDSIIPNITEVSPLIPKDISNSLGIGYIGRDIDIQKYHFMSLILGAKNVSLIYSKNDNTTKSRFIEELIWKKQLREKNLKATNIIEGIVANSKIKQVKNEYEKTDEIKKYLANMDYSAKSINTYMKCKLQFYYRYVLRLSEQVDYDNDYENIDIGNCIHTFLQNIFCKGFKHESLKKPDFKGYYNDMLEKYLTQYFSNVQTGNVFLLKKLIRNKMDFFYDNEIKRNFKEVINVEFDVNSVLKIGDKAYKLKARIDRADVNEDGTRYIIDYKTGKADNQLYKSFVDSSTFTREIVAKNIKSFQLIIYKYLYEQKYGTQIDNCIIYSIKDCKKYDLFDEKKDKTDIFKSTIKQLKYIVSEINSDEPFRSESYDNVNCEKCPYFYLCR